MIAFHTILEGLHQNTDRFMSVYMQQNARLIALTDALSDKTPRTAAALAKQFRVTERTIYRDMDRLTKSGVPIEGTPGKGYVLAPHVILPPLTLTPKELEALNLGLAVAQELADPDLANAIKSLTSKIDAAQPADQRVDNNPSPFSAPAKGLAHLRPLRAAVQARQMVQLVLVDENGEIKSHRLRPLLLEHRVRSWILTGYSETARSFIETVLETVQSVSALPELFADEPGKRLQDHAPQTFS